MNAPEHPDDLAAEPSTSESSTDGKHARHHTPETSERATAEVRELAGTQPAAPSTEAVDKSRPPEGKPPKPA